MKTSFMKICAAATFLLPGCSSLVMKTEESGFSNYVSPFLIYAGADLDHPYSGTGIELSDGNILVAFEKWTNDRKPPFESHIWLTRVKDGKVTELAKRLESPNQKFTYHPQFVSASQATYLYFNAFSSKLNTATFERKELSVASFRASEILQVQDNLIGQFRPWVYPFVSKNGKTVLTYEWRDPILERQRLKFAVGTNGLSFNESLDFGIGVMGRTSEFAGGTFIYTFQNGDPERTMDFFRISKNARQWTFERPISEQTDVHDAIPFQRLDGGIDIYYIASGGSPRNSVFRRSVSQNGILGPEQELTNKAVGSFMAPHPVRLKSGKIFLILTKEVVAQSNYDLFGVYIAGDATSG